MGFLKPPKMPYAQVLAPPPEPDFSYEDEAREQAAADDERRRARNRKGRRSTILTGSGLNEIEDNEINKKTLIG
jgi:hypothetical protein